VILVTGGMGFIGLHTARRLLDAGEEVVLTRFRTWRLPGFLEAELGSRLHVEAVDLADGWSLLDVMRRHQVASVVHLAAPALGTAPAQEYGSAIQGLLNVLEAARQQGARRVSVASSLAVYSNAVERPWREEAPLPVESDSHTAAAKKAMEVVGLHYGDRTGLDVVVLRLAAVYGPLYHSMANLPSRLCHAAVRGEAPSFDGVRGGPPSAGGAEDLCHVRDCAAGIALAHLCQALRHRVYNVGAGAAVTHGELIDAVARAVPAAETADSPQPRPSPNRGRENRFMDVSRLREETGFTPAYDIVAGVADYVSWLREHPF
jgi:UDP-glucose 4-epimerase